MSASDGTPSEVTDPSPDASRRLLSLAEEAGVFLRLRRRQLANLASQTWGEQRFRALVVVITSLTFWAGLFLVFVEGFAFVRQAIPHRDTFDQTVGAMFGMFYFSLCIMLLLSTAIILFGGLYRSRETSWLLTLPVRPERVFLVKFQEALFFSSWGFLLLGSPLVLAYGVVMGARWPYFVFAMAYLLPFVWVPGSMGAIACLLIVHRIPALVRHALAMGVAVIIAAVVWLGWNLLAAPASDLMTPAWFQEMLGRLEFSQHHLLPSWWMSAGILAASRGEWRESLMLLVVIVANALFWHQVAIWTAGAVYRTSVSALSGVRLPGKRLGTSRIDEWLLSRLRFLRPAVRVLFIKDLKVFRRDPVQWSQFLILFGLLGLYGWNLRRFTYDVHYRTWVNLISFMNVFVIGLVLATFTTRFIYPMISLEGRRFWILGLLPVSRDTILWSKFLFATTFTTIVAGMLIVVSDALLQVPLVVGMDHLFTLVVLCVGLSGMAVGLGAWIPNVREQSPSKIAAGIGGTLTLVLSSMYIVSVVILAAVPCHLVVAAGELGPSFLSGSSTSVAHWVDVASSRPFLLAGLGTSLVVGVFAAGIPLRLGIRAFRRMEF
jgi:ABC-2 type transport system permease protein